MSLDKFGRSAVPRDSGSSSSHPLPPHRGFIFTEDGNINIEKLKLCNVQTPTEDGDAVNKKYVDDIVNSILLQRLNSQMKRLNKHENILKQVNLDMEQQTISLKNIKEAINKLSNPVSANENELLATMNNNTHQYKAN